MSDKPLEYFLKKEHDISTNERNRTVNIPDSVHLFYKKASSNLDVGMSTLISNVLLEWIEKYGDDVTKEILHRFHKNR